MTPPAAPRAAAAPPERRPARLAAVRAGRSRPPLQTLQTQFTLVVSLLAFLPNLVLALASGAGSLSWSAAAWMLLVGLLSAVIGYVLSGALLRPLHRLELEVSEGDFAQFHADDPREIRSLRRAFGSLMTRLGTEQTRRNAFMATLVHDLKTPLIATGHLTRALTELPLPDDEKRAVGQEIQTETERLLALVQQMADAHRFERDDVQLHLAPGDLREVAEQAARRLRPQAEARGLSLHVSGSGQAEIDAAALERAVGNLTENALRYARHEVRLTAAPGLLRVQDDGPGLSASLDDLAQPFNAQPAVIAGQQYTAGTAGLGLFIVRRIAEAHGGTLRYGREPPRGRLPAAPGAFPLTTFTLVLPEVLP
ncbi:HAMP domain-containing histidine kinase [Deinococcus radiodurans]|nr:HAMP domain-containing sensor histidine kinase [Deinococcus radiodurans]ANC71905.1 two-component sensor histidine kinase [Deinococcus radiodurans R1 = ATCC 13939 = DSM 20539]QIP29007.1 HAMP domain-containing histidine kinase [Deinococcus radiodurans]QIP32285.1 HAMP domain-containing histidine kinase [Deinococcus radiodurans]UID69887.1 two-component sensor histidine kinase [Deinococcus radiodurans R1 = ATCC 13939 = DSM 20539]